MNLLTPTGYKDISEVNIGDELVAYDINTGEYFTNTLLEKHLWTNNMLPAELPIYNEEGELDYGGMTSEEVFEEIYGDWKFFKINNTWTLYKNQSVWCNMKVVHASDLQEGDTIYDDEDNDIIITSIEEVTSPTWWRLVVSGDHSFISEGIQLHNASRYWSGNMTPTSFNWNYTTGGTNWGSATGVADNATVPTSVDDVIFDGAGVKGNSNSIISANITILSLTFTSGYTSNCHINSSVTYTIAGNFTDDTAHTWSVTSTTSRMAISATSTITSNGNIYPGVVFFQGTNTKTINGDWTILDRLELNTANTTTVINKTNASDILQCGVYQTNFNTLLQGNVTLRVTGGFILAGGGNQRIEISQLEFAGNFNIPTITVGGTITLKYISGTQTTSGTLNNTSVLTLDTFPIVFTNYTHNSAANLTINSLFLVSGTFTNFQYNTSFLGTAGFTVGSLVLSNTVNFPFMYFKDGNTYTITNSLYTEGKGGFLLTISSTDASNRTNFILQNGASCNCNTDFRRIDASGGRVINSWNASAITDCVNIRSFTDLRTVATAQVN